MLHDERVDSVVTASRQSEAIQVLFSCSPRADQIRDEQVCGAHCQGCGTGRASSVQRCTTWGGVLGAYRHRTGVQQICETSAELSRRHAEAQTRQQQCNQHRSRQRLPGDDAQSGDVLRPPGTAQTGHTDGRHNYGEDQ